MVLHHCVLLSLGDYTGDLDIEVASDLIARMAIAEVVKEIGESGVSRIADWISGQGIDASKIQMVVDKIASVDPELAANDSVVRNAAILEIVDEGYRSMYRKSIAERLESMLGEEIGREVEKQ